MAKSRDSLQVETFPRLGGASLGAPWMPSFQSYNITEAKAYFDYAHHQHLNYQLHLIERGQYRCRLNNHCLELSPGQALLVKPGDWHQDTCEPPLRYFSLSFDLEGGDDNDRPSLLAPETAADRQVLDDPDGTLWPLAERMQQEGRVADAMAPHLQEALFLELFWRMVRRIPADILSPAFHSASSAHGFAAALERLFEQHVDRSLSVSAMAAAMHLSPSAFAHKCKSLLGAPPAQAYARFKMGRAAALLRNSAMSVKEVAACLGFDDPYHFSKCFKRILGASPSTYRA